MQARLLQHPELSRSEAVRRPAETSCPVLSTPRTPEPATMKLICVCARTWTQVTEFLQLTEFVVEEEPQHAPASAAAIDSLRNRPGPTPATVKPIYHNTGAFPPSALDARCAVQQDGKRAEEDASPRTLPCIAPTSIATAARAHTPTASGLQQVDRNHR